MRTFLGNMLTGESLLCEGTAGVRARIIVVVGTAISSS